MVVVYRAGSPGRRVPGDAGCRLPVVQVLGRRCIDVARVLLAREVAGPARQKLDLVRTCIKFKIAFVSVRCIS